jgi:hypothetical protein
LIGGDARPERVDEFANMSDEELRQGLADCFGLIRGFDQAQVTNRGPS